ncbi:hypothetical protein CLOP_g15364 [Closterium sp. NIES-67]|nr:hypothetical protein CLOP_g15364 [Closterium sp. NIES-67]
MWLKRSLDRVEVPHAPEGGVREGRVVGVVGVAGEVVVVGVLGMETSGWEQTPEQQREREQQQQQQEPQW